MAENKRVTLKEIAEKMGVSVGTVHCAIYGKKGVSEETKKLILEEVKRCNYQINEVASSLKRGDITVVVVLPKAQGEDRFYFRGIWEGIQQAAKELERYHVNFKYIESDYHLDEISEELIRLYDGELGDIHGLITISDDKAASAWAKRFVKIGIPTVLISSYEEDVSSVCSVKVDHEKAGKLAGEFIFYTMKEKPGKVLALTGNANIRSNAKYIGHFLDYMKKYCPQNEVICVEGFGADAIKEKVQKVLDEEPIIAIFSCNARNTNCLCEILKEHGKDKEMIVVGTDVFQEIAPFFEDGTLTASIYQSNREQGIQAVDILYRHLTGNNTKPSAVELPIALAMKYNYEFYMS